MILILSELRLHHSTIKFSRFLYTGKYLNNYYDILNLSSNCTAKDIKESFIKLSKENHPDINKSKNAHKKFLEINEAYKVLSKSESRRNYDLGFWRHGSDINENSSEPQVFYQGKPFKYPWKDPSFYENRDKSQDKYYQSQPYYGIKGVKRVSNITVVIICLCIASFALGMQMLAVRFSLTLRREDLIKKSNEARDSLKQIREAASTNGNEVQIELLKLRLVGKEEK